MERTVLFRAVGENGASTPYQRVGGGVPGMARRAALDKRHPFLKPATALKCVIG